MTLPTDGPSSGVTEVRLEVPLDLLQLYQDLARDSKVPLHEALVQGLRFAIRSRKARPRRRTTRPVPSGQPLRAPDRKE